MKKLFSKFFAWLRAVLLPLHINRVFVTSLLFAVGIAYQEAMTKSDQSWKAYAFAIGTVVIGFLANHWKLKGATLLGQYATGLLVVVDRYQNHPIPWPQLIGSLVLSFLMAYLGKDGKTTSPAPDIPQKDT